jgi:hypothetical protein
MKPFRTEIRNSPKEQTLKIYLSEVSLNEELREKLEKITGIRRVEIQKSISRNRVAENLTVYKEDREDINVVKENTAAFLSTFFDS